MAETPETTNPADEALTELTRGFIEPSRVTANISEALVEALKQLHGIDILAPHRTNSQLGSIAYQGLVAVAEKLRKR